MLLFVAFSAIIVPFILLVIVRMPARYAMTISAGAVTIGALTVWGMDKAVLAASAVQGIHRALSIVWILIGAMTLMYTLKETGAMNRIRQGFYRLSPDMRVQTIVVGFAFSALIEGVSGFGAPATIVAPLLIVLGFRPITAASLALVGDAVPVSFGAVGTPVILGLSNIPDAGLGLFQSVARTITYIDLVAAIVIPWTMVILLVYGLSDRPKKRQAITEILPWSLIIGGFYGATAIMTAIAFGPEFISIISGIATLFFAVLTIKKGWLIPKKPWRDLASKDTVAMQKVTSSMPLLLAWMPYIIIIVLLLATRTIPRIHDLLHQYGNISLNAIGGFESIHSSWFLLYSPGTILLIAAIAAAFMQKASPNAFFKATKESFKIALNVLITLLFTLIMVQIFTNSGINAEQPLSMPAYIGEMMAQNFGQIWSVLAPVLGMLGSFIVGSSTVSTLTMSPIQYNIAIDTNLVPTIVLAQQIVGANAGNIIAIHNVVAVAAIVGLAHREGHIMRKVFPCVVMYLGCIAVGSFIVYRLLQN